MHKNMNQKIDKLIEKVDRNHVEVVEKLDAIILILQKIEKDTNGMTDHISFIGRVYSKLKKPLDYVAARWGGSSIDDV